MTTQCNSIGVKSDRVVIGFLHAQYGVFTKDLSLAKHSNTVAFNTSCHEAAADSLDRIGSRSLDPLTWPQKWCRR